MAMNVPPQDGGGAGGGGVPPEGREADSETSSDVVVEPASSPKIEPYNQKKALDKARLAIAILLIFIAISEIFLCFALVWLVPSSADNAKEIMTIVFNPTIAVLGTAIGFYFGGGGKDEHRNG